MEAGLEPGRKLDLLAHIAYALAAVHGAGVIHRDLKPDNIILRNGDAPVLIDFGVALARGASQASWTPGHLPTWRPSRRVAAQSMPAPTCTRSA